MRLAAHRWFRIISRRARGVRITKSHKARCRASSRDVKRKPTCRPREEVEGPANAQWLISATVLTPASPKRPRYRYNNPNRLVRTPRSPCIPALRRLSGRRWLNVTFYTIAAFTGRNDSRFRRIWANLIKRNHSRVQRVGSIGSADTWPPSWQPRYVALHRATIKARASRLFLITASFLSREIRARALGIWETKGAERTQYREYDYVYRLRKRGKGISVYNVLLIAAFMPISKHLSARLLYMFRFNCNPFPALNPR